MSLKSGLNEKLKNCKFCHQFMGKKHVENHCVVDGWEDDKVEIVDADICEKCDRYKSQYIEYPLTVQGIENSFNKDCKYSLSKCGQLVKIKPCGKEYGGKTYLGILLGDLPIEALISFNHDDQKLHIGAMTNPAIFVPELKKIIYGVESWWGKIETPEDLKDITDDDIQNTWYVKLLQSMHKPEATQETESKVQS